MTRRISPGEMLSVAALAVLTLTVAAVVLCILQAALGGVWDYGAMKFLGGAWSPVISDFNLMPLLITTMIATSTATMFTVLLGTIAAVPLAMESGKPWVNFAEMSLTIWAGAPSVVVGLVLLSVVTPVLGFSLSAVICALTAMTLPTYTLSLAALMGQSLDGRYQDARALGFSLPRSLCYGLWPDIRRPATALGLICFARTFGEASAASLVAGGIIRSLPPGLLDPIETLPTAILKGFPVADGAYYAGIFVAAAVTLIIVATLVMTANWLRQRSP